MSLVDATGAPVTSEPTPQDGPAPVVETVTEGAKTPEFDFGKGNLAEQVKQLRATLAERGIAPPPAQEAPASEGAPKPEQKEGLKGSEMDWSEFDLQPGYAHFYPRAEFTVTTQGPKWVVVIEEYESFEKSYNGTGQDKKGNPRGLGDYITSRLNGPPDAGCGPWKLAAILPGTMGNGAVVLVRKVPIVLPDPVLLEKETKVEAPTEKELSETDDAAVAWAGGEAGEPTEEEVAGAQEAEAPSLAEQIAEEVISGPDTPAVE